jgi:hypothetical protein
MKPAETVDAIATKYYSCSAEADMQPPIYIQHPAKQMTLQCAKHVHWQSPALFSSVLLFALPLGNPSCRQLPAG